VGARSDAAIDSRWDSFANNLEHIARHRRMRFMTATAAVERLGD
jgi:hypothetical protein